MKKILAFLMFAGIAGCNSGTNQSEVASMKSSNDSATTSAVTYPYDVDYSSQFSISDEANAQKILTLWKDWDNGNIFTHKEYFADSVTLNFADGSVMKGLRDSVLAAGQSFRNEFKAVKSSVHAVIPLKSNDKKEDWVCVWGKEIHTDNKGVTDSVELMETWRINKEGKTDLLYQYNQMPPKAMAKK